MNGSPVGRRMISVDSDEFPAAGIKTVLISEEPRNVSPPSYQGPGLYNPQGKR